jgi:hypothetical protein
MASTALVTHVVVSLHSERFGLFLRLSQLLGKRTPLANDIVPGTNQFHFRVSPSAPSLQGG